MLQQVILRFVFPDGTDYSGDTDYSESSDYSDGSDYSDYSSEDAGYSDASSDSYDA